MKRLIVLLALAVLVAVAASAALGRNAGPGATTRCAKGAVAAKVGGKAVCLHVGLACKAALNSAYKRHGFTCVARHLRRTPKKGGSPVPPPTTTTTPSASFTLTSTAFADGEAIPATYTCDGANVSPPLSWTGAPAGTKSFALMLDDPNAPGGTFTHWITYNIPAGAAGLGEGQSGLNTGINDAGGQKYLGPCPPPTDGPHHYVFHLYALRVDTVVFENLAPGRPLFLAQIAGITLGKATLTGAFDH